MKRSHKLSIVYIVILFTGLSLWQLWKSSRIIEDPAYTKGVVNELYKFALLLTFLIYILSMRKPTKGMVNDMENMKAYKLVTLLPSIIKKVTLTIVKPI